MFEKETMLRRVAAKATNFQGRCGLPPCATAQVGGLQWSSPTSPGPKNKKGTDQGTDLSTRPQQPVVKQPQPRWPTAKLPPRYKAPETAAGTKWGNNNTDFFISRVGLHRDWLLIRCRQLGRSSADNRLGGLTGLLFLNESCQGSELQLREWVFAGAFLCKNGRLLP